MLDDVVENAREIQQVNYSGVAALAFLLWELCITFSDEISFIWSKTRSWPTKWAYILLRYYVLVVIFSTQTAGTAILGCKKYEICVSPHCPAWYKYQLASLQVVIALQQFIMASRVYALYRCSREIAVVLIASFVIEHTLISTFSVLTFPSMLYNGVCITVEVSARVVGIGLPPILYDLFLLILTIYKCIQTAPRSWRRTPLVWTLVRDGSWAFAVVVGVFCLNGLLFLTFDGPIASAAWAWQFAASSFTACRIVLRMHREAANSPSSGARLDLGPSISGPGPNVRARDDRLVTTEGFALTTFSPGVEFEESEPPDKGEGEV